VNQAKDPPSQRVLLPLLVDEPLRLLEQMAEEGILQQDGDEYRLQTAAGRTWDEAFRRHTAQLTDSEITTERDKLLREDVEKSLPASVVQGRARVARKVAMEGDLPGDPGPARLAAL
jgi:hypothetical protein